MNQPSAVALHGFVYSANFGDMLLCRLVLDMVRRHAPQARTSLPFATRKFLRSAEIEAPTGIRSFLESDVMLYQGGGYFSFGTRFELRSRARLYGRFYAPGVAAACLSKPYGIFGVGVGPLHSDLQRKAVRRVFEEAAVVAVRDEEGYDWVRRIGLADGNIHTTADLALGLTWDRVPAESQAEAERILASVPGPRLGLHLSAPSGTSAAYAAVMDGVVDYVGRHPELSIVLLCDHIVEGGEDAAPQYHAAMELQERLGKRAHFVGQPPLWTLVALLGKLDGLVTNKLHAGIVASALGRRVVSIAKNEKNFRFFRQIGAPGRCIHLNQATSVDIADFLERGLEDLPETPLPAELRALAMKNEELVAGFLNGGNGQAR